MEKPSRQVRKLKLQSGQSQVDCLIAALCTCIDLPIFQAKSILGHDGTEKLWPKLEEPLCYRGFTFAEIVMVAYLKGYNCVFHEFQGFNAPYYGIPPKEFRLPNVYRQHIIKHSIGIITLEQGNAFHAVAFCDAIIYDPRGTQYLLPEIQFQHIKACMTIEPRLPAFVSSHDYNTLSIIQLGGRQ